MFDLNRFDEYREDNSREVKKATENIPVSLWDTYSAFANCSGVPNIFGIWQDECWEEPVIAEQFNPDRTILELSFAKKWR